MKVFSGSSNLPLVNLICQNLGIPVGKVDLKTFPSGERYCQFQENIRGNDVFLVQSTSKPANDNLMELLVMCDAARRASAGRITAVVPYFGYARQDRKDKSRVPISAKLVMDLLEASGVNRILTMDLHSQQSVGFTNMPVDQLSFKPALVGEIGGLGMECVVAPDIGSTKRGDEYSSYLGIDLAIVSKKRNNATSVEVKHFIGDVNGKKVIIIDDLTESAGTLIEAAIACKEKGASEINCAISHGCFTDVGYKRLCEAFKNRLINRLFVSNSVDCANIKNWDYTEFSLIPDVFRPGNLQRIRADFNFSSQVTNVDVSSWFSRAITSIHNNESVSDLFR